MRKHLHVLLISALGFAAVIVAIRSAPRSTSSTQNTSKPKTERYLQQKSNQTPDQSELEKLSSLPYTNWSSTRTDIRKVGVVHFERHKAFGGLNLYNSRNLSEAHLMDMTGKIVHTWSMPKNAENSWHAIEMMKNGDLFAIVKDQKLIKLSWNSVVQWEYSAMFHHDLAVSSNGLIYVPTRQPVMWTTKHFQIPVVKEYITVLTEHGAFVKKINLFDVLSPLIPEEKIEKIRSWAETENIPERLNKKGIQAATWWENKKADVFHLNSIELIDKNIAGVAKVGDLLLSIRQLDLICVFRPETNELVWSWGPGEIQCQHHARFLKNDNILLFDNGCKRGYSRVIELNPKTKRIVWEYKTSLPKEFFSRTRGGVQRLPNGNTLITESDHGRVFEVSPDGSIVWEFLNSDVYYKGKVRGVIYRLMRIPEDFITKKLTP